MAAGCRGAGHRVEAVTGAGGRRAEEHLTPFDGRAGLVFGARRRADGDARSVASGVRLAKLRCCVARAEQVDRDAHERQAVDAGEAWLTGRAGRLLQHGAPRCRPARRLVEAPARIEDLPPIAAEALKLLRRKGRRRGRRLGAAAVRHVRRAGTVFGRSTAADHDARVVPEARGVRVARVR